jgi:hypothetical protein
MLCMAFAFGQNDLANCASPGLSGFWLWLHRGETVEIITEIRDIPMWVFFGCGFLMAAGMLTTYAQRVTRAEVNTGSQFDRVALYAPKWCRALARLFLRTPKPPKVLAPEPARTDAGRKIHYDTLRASVITGVSASVIAFASGHALPVSTTYVAFAAVLGTALSDRVFVRGDADRKLGRAIWVVTCWLLAPVIAIVATGCVALVVAKLSVFGLAIGLLLNITARLFFRRRSDAHEKRYHVAIGQKQAKENGLQPATGESDA